MEKVKKKLDFKSIIIICLIFIIFILVFTMINNSKAITLTKDNYNDYFFVTTSKSGDGNGTHILSIRSVSDNFNYENVEFKVRVMGEVKLKDNSTENIDKTITVKCNVGGNGSETIISNVKDFTYPEFKLEVIEIKGKAKK